MSYPDTGESGETYDVEMKDYYLGIYWYGTLCCARTGCRCEFQTYHDMLQHLKTGVCGAMNWDPLIRRLPFSRKREDLAHLRPMKPVKNPRNTGTEDRGQQSSQRTLREEV